MWRLEILRSYSAYTWKRPITIYSAYVSQCQDDCTCSLGKSGCANLPRKNEQTVLLLVLIISIF